MEMFFLLVIQPIIRLAALTRLEVSTIFQAHALIHASFVAETAVARVIAECTGTTGVIRTETGRNMFLAILAINCLEIFVCWGSCMRNS